MKMKKIFNFDISTDSCVIIIILNLFNNIVANIK